jgi:hypothetical protein
MDCGGSPPVHYQQLHTQTLVFHACQVSSSSKSSSVAAEAEPSPSKSQLRKQVKILKRQLEAAERALQDVTPPAERKRAREEVSPEMRSEKRTRATGMFEQGVIISPST